jgi:N-acetylmuramic acid 6-phosphate etherase
MRSRTTNSKWRRLRTEAENPASRSIDTLSALGIVRVMAADQRRVLAAVDRERTRIARAAEIVARAFRAGGRIVFIGAGTSGRLGVLEAAELPPTFGIAANRAVAIMAGGAEAVGRAREGVEDDSQAGANAARRLRLTRRDVVIGISASGVTPFVQAAVAQARRAGAGIVAITCDPGSPLKRGANVFIVLATGAEVVAGSTRLKAGTATKMALNMITTSAMVRAGKTYGNLMVDVQINSDKLRDRARRIISAVTGLTGGRAAALLRRAGGGVKVAIVMQQAGVSRAEAVERIRVAGDSVRKAIKTSEVFFTGSGKKDLRGHRR